MPKPYKLFAARPLPADAELVDVAGKPHARIRERGKPTLYKLSKDRTKYLRPSKRWYFDVRDGNGTVRRVKGFADLKATEQLASDRARKAERITSGFSDPAEEHARRPLAEHLKDYAAHLEAKGNTPDHTKQTVSRVASLLSGCGSTFPKDVDAVRVVEWLNALRRDRRPVELPAGADAFAPSEAARIVGLTPDGLRKAVALHRLPATGNGKARRLPRATVEALAEKAGRGIGPATVNHYVGAVRGFFRWLVKAKRLGSNPLESLSLLNERVDIRRTRRELTADELRTLFTATRESARTFRGLTGPDRYMLYLVAAGTGFRAGSLAALTPADFDLNAESPTVTLSARFAKNRKTKVQPLPADVAETLRGYLPGKAETSPVWGGTWQSGGRMAEMLRMDLEAAGIAYAVEGPDGPEYADFHALRHSFLTLGGRSGIDLRTLQELAGHSTPVLTARYMHVRLRDAAGAVDKLPNLVPSSAPTTSEIPLRMTGTDTANAVVPAVVTGGISGHQSASFCNNPTVWASGSDDSQSLKNKPNGTILHHSASGCISEGAGDRTQDQRIKSHNVPDSIPFPGKDVTANDPPRCSAGCSAESGEGGISDPDLARVVDAWPALPDALKRAVLALVGAAG